MKSPVLITVLLLAGTASADDASLPWQLHAMTTRNVVEADSGAAVFRDPQGNIDIAETTVLSARVQLADGWAPMLGLGFVGNNAPGAALDGASVGNPIAGVTYTRDRLAVFGALAIPVGSAGSERATKANAAAITARPADEAMFDVDHATAILGADAAYVARGFTAQAEVSLSPSVRARGDGDAFRMRGALGGHVGMFLGAHVSVGADLQYQRWISPAMDAEPSTLTASLGARVHFHVGNASIHPGLSYTRGLDGFALAGPMTITRQTNAIAIAIPVQF